MFIGGFKRDGVWFWREKSSDFPILHADWAAGQPDGVVGEYQCVVMFNDTSHSNAHRDIDHCSSKMAFICEKTWLKTTNHSFN